MMKLSEVVLVVSLVMLVMAWGAGLVDQAQAQDDGPLGVEMGAMPTATPETVYVDLEWGQKLYVLCGEIERTDAQPAGEIGAVSFAGDSWGVECYPPGTNERGVLRTED